MINNRKAFTGLLVVGILAVIVGASMLYIGLFINATLGNQFDSTLTPGAGTGTLTFTVNITENQTVILGSETYTFVNTSNTSKAAFNVAMIGNALNASLSCSRLVTEVNANSTLVSAGTCSTNATTVTAASNGNAGNYASTTNVTGASWGSATLTGGADGNSAWAGTKNNVNTSFTILGLALLVGGFSIVIYTLRTGFVAQGGR